MIRVVSAGWTQPIPNRVTKCPVCEPSSARCGTPKYPPSWSQFGSSQPPLRLGLERSKSQFRSTVRYTSYKPVGTSIRPCK